MHPWVHSQLPSGSQESINKLTSSPNSHAQPHMDIAPGQPSDPFYLSLSHPFAGTSSQCLLPSHPVSLWMIMKGAAAVLGFPSPHLFPESEAGTPCRLPTTTFRKSKVPAGTKGQTEPSRILSPRAPPFHMHRPHAKPLQLLCPPPGILFPTLLGKYHSGHLWAQCGPTPCPTNTHCSKSSCSPCIAEHHES